MDTDDKRMAMVFPAVLLLFLYLLQSWSPETMPEIFGNINLIWGAMILITASVWIDNKKK